MVELMRMVRISSSPSLAPPSTSWIMFNSRNAVNLGGCLVNSLSIRKALYMHVIYWDKWFDNLSQFLIVRELMSRLACLK